MPDLRSTCKRLIALPLLIGISSLGAANPASAQSCLDDCDYNNWMCLEGCRFEPPWSTCLDECKYLYQWCKDACNPPSDETVIKNRLNDMVSPVLGQLQDPQFRNLVKAGVARRFDGDDNVLLSDVINEAEQAQIVDPNSPIWQSFKAQVASFQDVNGTAYDPQIYIPNYQDGALPTPDVTVVVMETDPNLPSVPAYQWVGGSRQYIGHVNEAYSESSEVFVLSINERVVECIECGCGSAYYSPPPQTSGHSSTGCSGSRISGGRESIVSLKIPNPQQYEHWTQGRLELRVIIVGKGGAEIKNFPFQKINRKKLRTGYTDEHLFVTTWDRAIWGDYMIYKWLELDGERKGEFSLNLSTQHAQNINSTTSLKSTFERKHYDMGNGPVVFTEPIEFPYSIGTTNPDGTPLAGIFWRLCNVYP